MRLQENRRTSRAMGGADHQGPRRLLRLSVGSRRRDVAQTEVTGPAMIHGSRIALATMSQKDRAKARAWSATALDNLDTVETVSARPAPLNGAFRQFCRDLRRALCL